MFDCGQCGRDMKNNQALKRHIARKIPCAKSEPRCDKIGDELCLAVSKKFACPLCSKQFKFASQKSLHKKTCNGPLQENVALISPSEPSTSTNNDDAAARSTDNEPSTSEHAKTQYEVLDELVEFAKNNNVPSQVHDAISAFTKMIKSQTQTVSLSNSDNANVITTNQNQSNNTTTNSHNISIVINNYGKEDTPVSNEMLAQCLANRDTAVQTLFRHIFLNPEYPSNQTIRPGTRGLNVKTLQAMDNRFWKDVLSNDLLEKVIRRMAKLVYHYYADETVQQRIDYSDLIDKWHDAMCDIAHRQAMFFKVRREVYAMIYEFKFVKL